MSAATDLKEYLDNVGAKVGCFYLCTVDGDKPACRPLGFKMVRDDKFYLGIGTFKDAFKQIQANPNIQIVACADRAWVRVSATAVIDDDPAVEQAALDIAVPLRKIYNEETGNKLGMIYLKDVTAQYYENTMELAKTVEF